MFDKSWVSDEQWLPNEWSHLVVFSHVPTGEQRLLQPDHKSSFEIQQLANKVQKCCVRLDICQRGWMKEYFATQQEIRKL